MINVENSEDNKTTETGEEVKEAVDSVNENVENEEKVENVENTESKENVEEPKVIETADSDLRDGQTKCPKCGSTDISLNSKNGKLRCNFCRHEFEPKKMDSMEKDISKLKGVVLGSGAKDLKANSEDSAHVVTLKCTSCGAEVVIDTADTTQARCHWCRNMLSINNKLPNGAVPDEVLPFKIPKKEAEDAIQQFVRKRRFFANPTFRREFSTENVMGVYLPYMVVDENTSVSLEGQGEHQTRSYTIKVGDNYETRYDADVYNVTRDFDMTIEGLTVESSADKLDDTKSKTNNIINSIMPFDIENAVKWDSNYLKGYSSEKRDVNVSSLSDFVKTQSQDIARFQANSTAEFYDRGIKWEKEAIDIKGQQWTAAYLPVWLYSYYQQNKGLLHYVAVNARTKETMGSVPIHMPKLLITSFFVEIIGIVLMLLSLFFIADDDSYWPYIFLCLGVVFYAMMYGRYRNSGARHHHESETKAKISNVKKTDNFVKHKNGQSSSTMNGANNKSVRGVHPQKKILSEKLTHALEKELGDVKDDIQEEQNKR